MAKKEKTGIKSIKKTLGLNLKPVEILQKPKEKPKFEEKKEKKEDAPSQGSQFSERILSQSIGFSAPAIKAEAQKQAEPEPVENLEQFAAAQPPRAKETEKPKTVYAPIASSYGSSYSASSKYSSTEERAGYELDSRQSGALMPRVPERTGRGLGISSGLISERQAPEIRVSPAAGREAAEWQSPERAQLEEFSRQQEQYRIQKAEEAKQKPFRRGSRRV